MSANRRALYVMPDQMPSLRQLQSMAGCHFAPRCPLAAEECRRSEPPNVAIAAGHNVACLRASATPSILTVQQTAAAQRVSKRGVLQVERLAKHYEIGRGLFKNSSAVAAVKDASFSVAENEFVGLVGDDVSLGEGLIAIQEFEALAALEAWGDGVAVEDDIVSGDGGGEAHEGAQGIF